MKLINNQPSPFGRKVMIALFEKSIPFEIEWDIPWHKDTKVNHYSPLEQLPILISDDGDVVYESSYILDWLEYHYPTPSLRPETEEERLREKLFQVLSVGVMDAIVRINFELARPKACQSGEWIQRQKRKVSGGLREISQMLSDSSYAVGNRLSHADLEIGSVLGHLDFLSQSIPALNEFLEQELRWRETYPNLGIYIDDLEARPSFKNATPQMVEIDFQSVME